MDRLARLAYLLCLCIALALGSSLASATTIDFEAQGPGPIGFIGVATPLVIDGVTFTAGLIMTHEFGFSPDQTTVLGTASFCEGCTNPIDISFSTTVSDLSLLLTNNIGGTYTLVDQLGRSAVVTLGYPNEEAILILSFSGINEAFVSHIFGTSPAFPTIFDFAIDNVTFDTAAPVPEPSSSLVLGTGLLVGAGVLRRKLLG